MSTAAERQRAYRQRQRAKLEALTNATPQFTTVGGSFMEELAGVLTHYLYTGPVDERTAFVQACALGVVPAVSFLTHAMALGSLEAGPYGPVRAVSQS